MEVITIEETASKTIMEKLDLIADYIMQTKKNTPTMDTVGLLADFTAPS